MTAGPCILCSKFPLKPLMLALYCAYKLLTFPELLPGPGPAVTVGGRQDTHSLIGTVPQSLLGHFDDPFELGKQVVVTESAVVCHHI